MSTLTASHCEANVTARDRAAWSIGRLVIWSNELFLEIGMHLGFPDAPSARDFIWWVWSQQRVDEDPLAGL